MPDENQTEAPSQRRLQHALEEGNIPISRDLASWGTLASALCLLSFQGPALRDGLLELMRAVADGAGSAGVGDGSPVPELTSLAGPVVSRVLGICVAMSLFAAALGLVQTRGRIWPELVGLRLERLYSASALKRFVSKDLLVDIGLAAFKVAAIAVALWTAVGDAFLTHVHRPGGDPIVQLHETAELVRLAVSRAVAVLLLFAGTDFALAWQRHRKKLRMSKDELKRENREEDGDPLIRSRRRRKHKELARAQARKAVPKADALIVNPTHIAVAIRYQRGRDRAPRVTAKGKGVLAEHMRELARENQIPIVEDIPLARLLYKKVKVNGEVPLQTYQAVAAILAFVYRVTGKTPPKPKPAVRPQAPAAKPAQIASKPAPQPTAAPIRRTGTN